MEKPVVCVRIGTTFQQLAGDVIDALIANNQYSQALELNSILLDAPNVESALNNLLSYVTLNIQ